MFCRGLGVASYLQGNLMRHLWCAGMEEHGAADVFQTVFTRLVKHLPRRRDADKLQAWCLDERPRSQCFQCGETPCRPANCPLRPLKLFLEPTGDELELVQSLKRRERAWARRDR
jgi:hypothetical protein